jgi:predicted DNA-binding transcriptional regulator YafY
MPSKVIYERFLWFHATVKGKKYPNTKSLAEKFEITRKTAQRDIDFMRDRLGAPLCYLHEYRGYAYQDDTWDLPAYWLGEEELTSLIVSYRLASAIPDSILKISFRSFLDQVLSKLSHSKSVSISALSNKISVKNIEYSRTNEMIFHRILESLLYSKPVAIEYYSPHNAEFTVRDILPLHLLQYMGTWHIIAHCALKDGLRDFVLSRIKSVAPSPNAVNQIISGERIKEYIRKNFGIMNNAKTIEVCLRFAPGIASWVTEQVWHPTQQVKREMDNALCLTLPVTDFREIKREILKYGAQMEVISPEELREEVKEEIRKMENIYS